MQELQSKRRRQRRPVEEIQAILADFERSGLSVLRYARDHGLATTTLTYWRKKYLAKPSSVRQQPSSPFVELRPDSVQAPVSSSQLELLLGNGLTLRFSASVLCSVDLKDLVSCLRAC